jgi:hypothetical protein
LTEEEDDDDLLATFFEKTRRDGGVLMVNEIKVAYKLRAGKQLPK